MSSRFLDHQNRMTRAEVAICAFMLLTTFRINRLPSVLAEAAGAGGLWVVLVGIAVDLAVLAASLWTARMGGLGALPLHPIAKRILGGLLGLFCLFKGVFYTQDIVGYCMDNLFNQATVWVLVAVGIVMASLLAVKGFAGIGRTALIFGFLSLALVAVSLVFLEPAGETYNLFALFHPFSFGKGFLKSALWMGDGVLFVFADTRENMRAKRRWLWPVIGTVAAVLSIVLFYIDFLYTYGSAGQYIQYAFARMLVNGAPEVIGAVDWPLMLVWLLMVPPVLGLFFYAACEGARQVCGQHKHKGEGAVIGCAVLAVGLYAALFYNKDGALRLVESTAVSTVIWCVLLVVCILAAVAAAKRRGKAPATTQKEKKNEG